MPPDPLTCDCASFSGDPAQLGDRAQVVASTYYQGWADLTVRCATCGTLFAVQEDVGYHFPQYSWQRA